MLGISAVVWVMMVYGRGVRYAWLMYQMALELNASGSFVMLAGGVVSAALMSLVNLLFVADATRKLYKYVNLMVQPEPTGAKDRIERVKMIKRASSSCLSAGSGRTSRPRSGRRCDRRSRLASSLRSRENTSELILSHRSDKSLTNDGVLSTGALNGSRGNRSVPCVICGQPSSRSRRCACPCGH